MSGRRGTDIYGKWVQHQRRNHNKTKEFIYCAVCSERPVFPSVEDLSEHMRDTHPKNMPSAAGKYEPTTADNRSVTDANSRPELQMAQAKRSLPGVAPRSLSALQELNLGSGRDNEDVSIGDVSDRATVADSISAGTGTPPRETSSPSPPRTCHSPEYVERKHLWSDRTPLTRPSLDAPPAPRPPERQTRDILSRLVSYTKSLCIATPSPSARDFISTFFDPTEDGQRQPPLFETSFVKLHGLLLTKPGRKNFRPAVLNFLKLLDNHIDIVTSKFLEQGAHIAVLNLIALHGYGDPESHLRRAITNQAPLKNNQKAMWLFRDAGSLTVGTLITVLKRIEDLNILPFLHVTLVFMHFVYRSRAQAMKFLNTHFPWHLLIKILNLLLKGYNNVDRIDNPEFPRPPVDLLRPLAEEFAMSGLEWAEGYDLKNRLSGYTPDTDENDPKAALRMGMRKERILWIACQICKNGSWMKFDKGKRQFSFQKRSAVGHTILAGTGTPHGEEEKLPLTDTQNSQMGQAKRTSPGEEARSFLPASQDLGPGSGRDSEDLSMQDVSDDGQPNQLQERTTIGESILAGAGTPPRASPSPPRLITRQGPESDIQRSPVSETDRKPVTRPSPAAPPLFPPATSTRAGKQPVLQSSNIMRNENLRNTIHQVRHPGLAQIYTNKGKTGPAEEVLVDEPPRIIREPETRPISQEQLVAEVKGIYAGLVMVEAKCMEVDNKQAVLAQGDPASQPTNKQLQALFALHRTLLHEHYDFFMASQHPSASPALHKLASKYAMPARLWRHGIHSFLELLRHWLPASIDLMLAFIYFAYSMMALLFETVPDFEDTWIECLGDLGRYRMAIEDDDVRDRDVWTGVARHWYSKASDNAPGTGRLYHHIAITARPNSLMQLFYYTKSLCVAVPFPSARYSILTLFDPVLSGDGQHRLPPFETSFVRAHGLLFTKRDMENFQPAVLDFLKLLDNHIGRVTRKFRQQGVFIAVSNIIAILEYGKEDSPLMMAIKDTSRGTTEATSEVSDTTEKKAESSPGPSIVKCEEVESSPGPSIVKREEAKPCPEASTTENTEVWDARSLVTEALKIVLKRIGDPNVFPFVHVTLVFLYFISSRPQAMKHLEARFPWKLLTEMLNPLVKNYTTVDRIENSAFPVPVKDHVHPFIEDYGMRGLIWAEDYFPITWFAEDKRGIEERHLEAASMVDVRKERILWVACQICKNGSWMTFDREKRQFSATLVDSSSGDSSAPDLASALDDTQAMEG